MVLAIMCTVIIVVFTRRLNEGIDDCGRMNYISLLGGYGKKLQKERRKKFLQETNKLRKRKLL